MKIRQTVRHFATRKALQTPVVGARVHDWLVDFHSEVFLDRAPEERRAERRDHLDALFDGTVDLYQDALEAGYTEAEAREITHIVANFDFYDHGWASMLEFPPEEVEDHYERYRDFFERHGVAVERPLGEYTPPGGLPEAPATPERLAGEAEHAEGGYADDVYVEDGTGSGSAGGQDEPEDVDTTDAPGVN